MLTERINSKLAPQLAEPVPKAAGQIDGFATRELANLAAYLGIGA